MIRSFRQKEAEALFRRFRVKRFEACESVARRKLAQLDAAATLDDLRVNDQWRICFVWTEHGPAEVEIVDYH